MGMVFSRFKECRSKIAFLGIISGFLTLVFLTISKASIWFDEAFSAYIIRFNFAEIWHYTSVDVHPPLYYFLLKIWSIFFGSSDFVLRSLSAFFGVLTIILAYFLVKRLYNKKIALLASSFLAISPMLIRYSQEARMYTMVAFLSVLTVRAFYEAWVAENTMKSKKKWRIIYIIAVCAGIWTQYLYALIPISLWIFRTIYILDRQGKKSNNSKLLLFFRFRNWKNDLRRFLSDFFAEKWFSSHLTIVVLYIPWIPFFISQATYVKAKFWIPALNFSTIPNMISNFLFYLDADDTNGWLSIVAMIILLIVVFFMFKKLVDKDFNDNLRINISVSIAPVILLYIASLPPFSSIFVDRYLLMAEVFMSILLAIISIKLFESRKSISVILTLLIIFSHIFGVFQLNLQKGISKNGGEITEIRQAIEKVRNEESNATIAVGGFLFYSAAQYSNSKSKVWFYGEPPIYRSGDMIRSDYTLKIESSKEEFSSNKEFFVITPYSDDVNKNSPISGYKLSKEIDYNNSINGSPLYKILKFIKK